MLLTLLFILIFYIFVLAVLKTEKEFVLIKFKKIKMDILKRYVPMAYLGTLIVLIMLTGIKEDIKRVAQIPYVPSKTLYLGRIDICEMNVPRKCQLLIMSENGDFTASTVMDIGEFVEFEKSLKRIIDRYYTFDAIKK